jgi:hypothetical protein
LVLSSDDYHRNRSDVVNILIYVVSDCVHSLAYNMMTEYEYMTVKTMQQEVAICLQRELVIVFSCGDSVHVVGERIKWS